MQRGLVRVAKKLGKRERQEEEERVPGRRKERGEGERGRSASGWGISFHSTLLPGLRLPVGSRYRGNGSSPGEQTSPTGSAARGAQHRTPRPPAPSLANAGTSARSVGSGVRLMAPVAVPPVARTARPRAASPRRSVPADAPEPGSDLKLRTGLERKGANPTSSGERQGETVSAAKREKPFSHLALYLPNDDCIF